MNCLKILIKRAKLLAYNKKHKTNIRSYRASLGAEYMNGVSIYGNTIVDSNCKIGKYTYINTNSSAENCEIGNYCSISSGVNINPFEHNYRLKTTHPFAYTQKMNNQRVIIGHDVLISLNVIILQGVNIGSGAVIGAGAVVTKDVMPFEIVGGVPAKHIGWRFNQEIIDEILKSNWWNKDVNELTKNIEWFQVANTN